MRALTAAHLCRHDLQALFNGRDIVAGDRNLVLGRAQFEIGARQIAGERQPRMAEQCGMFGKVGIGGFERAADRSEEHTSELQSLMRISYAVFCLKQKNCMITTHDYTSSYYDTQ